MKIAVISPSGLGGVHVITLKLFNALKLENFEVDLFYVDHGAVNPFVHDLRLVKKLKDYDFIIYTGSIARISSLLAGKRFAIFIHGLLFDEYKNTILHSDIRTRLGALLEFAWWGSVNMKFFKPDFYICHSITTRNYNKISNPTSILPQFILPSEIKYFQQLQDSYRNLSEVPKIMAYRSYAKSPRLLPQASLIHVARLLGNRLKKKVLFYIIDPTIPYEETYDYGMVKLNIIRAMPRTKFLKSLASSDLYIETSIDEEIGLDSIEAGLLKVPLAKITYPQYTMLQDYTEDEVIIASSPLTLTDTLSEYFTNIDQNKQYYGSRFNQYLLKKRSWNVVKKPLLNKLLE